MKSVRSATPMEISINSYLRRSPPARSSSVPLSRCRELPHWAEPYYSVRYTQLDRHQGAQTIKMQDKSLNDATARNSFTSGPRQTKPKYPRIHRDDNELGPIGCRILSSSSILSKSTELSLNNNKIKDVGLKALANADLTLIEDLSLSFIYYTQATITSLRKAWKLYKVRSTAFSVWILEATDSTTVQSQLFAQ